MVSYLLIRSRRFRHCFDWDRCLFLSDCLEGKKDGAGLELVSTAGNSPRNLKLVLPMAPPFNMLPYMSENICQVAEMPCSKRIADRKKTVAGDIRVACSRICWGANDIPDMICFVSDVPGCYGRQYGVRFPTRNDVAIHLLHKARSRTSATSNWILSSINRSSGTL